MTDLKGKTTLVTGSTSGIGKATAITLAAHGAHVLVVGRNEQRAKDVVAEIEASGGRATFAAISWYNSPEYQQLIDVRSVAMEARFSLLDGLPTRPDDEPTSQ